MHNPLGVNLIIVQITYIDIDTNSETTPQFNILDCTFDNLTFVHA